MARSVTVLSPVVVLGSRGINPEAFARGLDYDPDVVAMDAGSLDYGPHPLGTGTPYFGRGQVKSDLETVLPAARERNVPVLVGTAGSSGSRAHVDWTLDVVEEVVDETDLDLDVTVVESDVERATLRRLVETRRVEPVGHDRPLERADVDASDRVVAQMGIEPLVRALEDDPDLVVAGRACDNAVMAAFPVRAGLPKGLALHMGTILECADLAATPKPGRHAELEAESDATSPLVGTITADSFTITPADPRLACTELSIAAHALYESRDPYRSTEPGGTLDTTDSRYEQVDGETVRVTGSEFVPSEEYMVKLEGAGVAGYRTVCVMGVRDPRMVERIGTITDDVTTVIERKYRDERDVPCEVVCRVYGRDGTMGALEPNTEPGGHEVGLVLEVVSDTQAHAREVCGSWKSRIFHGRFGGGIPSSGTVAFPFSPPMLDVGPVVDLTVHHAVSVVDPFELTRTYRRRLPQEVLAG